MLRCHGESRIGITSLEFRRLENIDRELKDLKALEERFPKALYVEPLDLSSGRDSLTARKVLKTKLTGGRFDVVHFAGHSLTTKDALTLLVLPGECQGEAEGMWVEEFAELAARAGAKLVYLSSCQGSSANTVASLGQRNMPNVLGFRWDVKDDHAAKFANIFYSKLFGESSAPICYAFQTACHDFYHDLKHVEEFTIWASPILASRSDNWTAQGIF